VGVPDDTIAFATLKEARAAVARWRRQYNRGIGDDDPSLWD
jgi:hypothetical protein